MFIRSAPIIGIFLLHTIASNAQRVGIGTTNPAALLEVADSAVLFSNRATSFASPVAAPPAQGMGVRMMWYPQKAAFRAGAIDDGSLKDGFSNLYSTTNWNRDSIGFFSFAGGYNTKAKGVAAVAFGNTTEATAEGATALGSNTVASGVNAVAMGAYSSAPGEGGWAAGYNTKANGTYTSALGYETITNSFASLTIGSYNLPLITQPSYVWSESEPLLILGNGLNDLNRRNALVVLKNGNTGVNVNIPKAKLSLSQDGVEVGGTAASTLLRTSGGSLNTINSSQLSLASFGFLAGNNSTSLGIRAIRNANGSDWTTTSIVLQYDVDNNIQAAGATGYLALAANGNIGIGTATPTQKLQVAGNILANNVTVPSDARYKTNIQTIPEALDQLLRLRGTKYYYNTNAFPDMHFNTALQTGLIAQEVEKVFPGLVITGADGYKSVNYTGLIPVLLEGIKTQQQQINQQQQQLNHLQAQLKELQRKAGN